MIASPSGAISRKLVGLRLEQIQRKKYDFEYVLLLGRVTTGSGGEHIIERSKEVMAAEFPELAARIKFHIPDETEKRHGQAVAAASLPKIG